MMTPKICLFAMMLSMAGNLYAVEALAPADNVSCDYDPATPQPLCAPDEHLIAPPRLADSDDSAITPSTSSGEAVQDESKSKASIPPPAPVPTKPQAPAEESPGDVPPPQPKPQP